LDRTTDISHLGLHPFRVFSYELESFDRFFNTVFFDVPARAFGAEPEQSDNADGCQELEKHGNAPVPVAESFAVVRAGEVDPVGHE
jgi:hypothetical protein